MTLVVLRKLTSVVYVTCRQRVRKPRDIQLFQFFVLAILNFIGVISKAWNSTSANIYTTENIARMDETTVTVQLIRST